MTVCRTTNKDLLHDKQIIVVVCCTRNLPKYYKYPNTERDIGIKDNFYKGRWFFKKQTETEPQINKTGGFDPVRLGLSVILHTLTRKYYQAVVHVPRV